MAKGVWRTPKMAEQGRSDVHMTVLDSTKAGNINIM